MHLRVALLFFSELRFIKPNKLRQFKVLMQKQKTQQTESKRELVEQLAAT